MAKLWGVIKGLELAWSLEYQQVEVELDSRVLIDKMQQGTSVESTVTTLFYRCRGLIQRNWKVCFVHTYKEGNKVAN